MAGWEMTNKEQEIRNEEGGLAIKKLPECV
jgi:hypothetical protein